jgi:hypothetical protein
MTDKKDRLDAKDFQGIHIIAAPSYTCMLRDFLATHMTILNVHYYYYYYTIDPDHYQ